MLLALPLQPVEQAQKITVGRGDAAQHVLAKERVERGSAEEATEHRGAADVDHRGRLGFAGERHQRAVPEPDGERQRHHPAEVTEQLPGCCQDPVVVGLPHRFLLTFAPTIGPPLPRGQAVAVGCDARGRSRIRKL